MNCFTFKDTVSFFIKNHYYDFPKKLQLAVAITQIHYNSIKFNKEYDSDKWRCHHETGATKKQSIVDCHGLITKKRHNRTSSVITISVSNKNNTVCRQCFDNKLPTMKTWTWPTSVHLIRLRLFWYQIVTLSDIIESMSWKRSELSRLFTPFSTTTIKNIFLPGKTNFRSKPKIFFAEVCHTCPTVVPT